MYLHPTKSRWNSPTNRTAMTEEERKAQEAQQQDRGVQARVDQAEAAARRRLAEAARNEAELLQELLDALKKTDK